MTAFQEFQKKMQDQVLAMWPDKLPPQLAGRSREELEKFMGDVAKLSNVAEGDLPKDLPEMHRFFLDYSRRRYRDLLQMGSMMVKMRSGSSAAQFQAWMEKNVPAANREEVELSMRAVQEAK